MSVDNSGLIAFQKKLEALRDDIPEIMDKLIIGEGVFAVGEAKKICKNEKGLVNTGSYRNNFHAGDKAMAQSGKKAHDGAPPKRSGKWYKIDVYNNLDYAKPLEYGFRSHFVPGYWSGHSFVYQPGFPGGMYVGKPGGYVRGHFTLKRAIHRTKITQDARLQRKMNKIIKDRMK